MVKTAIDSQGYLRTNYRTKVNGIILVWHSNATAKYFSDMTSAGYYPPSGLIALTGIGSLPQILVYNGAVFYAYSMDGSTNG